MGADYNSGGRLADGLASVAQPVDSIAPLPNDRLTIALDRPMDSESNIWKQHLEHVALTDVGMRRGNNQDSFAVVLAGDPQHFLSRGHVFVVADGMGAHAAGELASKMAADGIPHTYNKLADQPAPAAIVKAVQDANAMIHQRGHSSPDFSGMGTTSSTLVLLPHGAMVAHAGDSRIYRVRGPAIEQLTFDHSLQWEMRAAGGVAPELLPKNVITRSLGPHPKVQVDLEGPFPVQVGDKFLLCSDGLSGQVTDEEIGAFLNAMPIAEAAQSLIDLANLRGGPDNTTIIIAKILSTELHQPTESLVVQHSDGKAAQRRSVPFMVTGGALALLAVVFIAVRQWIPAAISGGLAVLAGIIALATKLRANIGPSVLPPGAMLGKGPHTRSNATPNAGIVASVSKVVDQLREAAAAEKWPIDWFKFDPLMTNARIASANGDFAKALRETARAMSTLLGQLKKVNLKRRRVESDEVDLA